LAKQKIHPRMFIKGEKLSILPSCAVPNGGNGTYRLRSGARDLDCLHLTAAIIFYAEALCTKLRFNWGANWTLMAQLAPGATLVPQLLVCRNMLWSRKDVKTQILAYSALSRFRESTQALSRIC